MVHSQENSLKIVLKQNFFIFHRFLRLEEGCTEFVKNMDYVLTFWGQFRKASPGKPEKFIMFPVLALFPTPTKFTFLTVGKTEAFESVSLLGFKTVVLAFI